MAIVELKFDRGRRGDTAISRRIRNRCGASSANGSNSILPFFRGKVSSLTIRTIGKEGPREATLFSDTALRTFECIFGLLGVVSFTSISTSIGEVVIWSITVAGLIQKKVKKNKKNEAAIEQ